MTLKLTAIGDSTGRVLPKENLHGQGVERRNALDLETPPGLERPLDTPDFAAQIEVAEGVMREDHDVLQNFAE